MAANARPAPRFFAVTKLAVCKHHALNGIRLAVVRQNTKTFALYAAEIVMMI